LAFIGFYWPLLAFIGLYWVLWEKKKYIV